jgi:hypothetical protein
MFDFAKGITRWSSLSGNDELSNDPQTIDQHVFHLHQTRNAILHSNVCELISLQAKTIGKPLLDAQTDMFGKRSLPQWRSRSRSK